MPKNSLPAEKSEMSKCAKRALDRRSPIVQLCSSGTLLLQIVTPAASKDQYPPDLPQVHHRLVLISMRWRRIDFGGYRLQKGI